MGREHQGDSSASKPELLSLISETHMVEGELSPEDNPLAATSEPWQVYPYIYKINEMSLKKKIGQA